MGDTFSSRHGYTSQPRPITVREDAPKNLRWFVLQTALEQGIQIGQLRLMLCKRLRRVPPDFVRDYERKKLEEMLYSCPWYTFYDLVEDIYRQVAIEDAENFRGQSGFVAPAMVEREPARATIFEVAVNEFFVAEGIGWKLANGQVTARGEEAFEAAVNTARAELEAAGRPTAARRIHEALRDLSRRPDPDYAGAISHALSALEATAKDITQHETLTLGQLVAQGRLNAFIPSENIRKSLEHAWKYANDEGARHGREGSEPGREEAELIVGLSALLVTYLNRRTT